MMTVSPQEYVRLSNHEESAMPKYRSTKTPGVMIRHQVNCPAADTEGPRCRCQPSYRGKRRHPVTRAPEHSPTFKDRAEVLTWLGAGDKGAASIRDRAAAGRTLTSLYDEWIHGAETGAIASSRKGARYSETTLDGYRRAWRNVLEAEFGHRPASAITEGEWQAWADSLARQGLSRSRIANLLAVVAAVYRWASRPSRKAATGVDRNPIKGVDLPGAPEQPRLRVAQSAEAEELLAALAEDDQVPFALAFYAGMRRAEIHRLDWSDVQLDGYRITVGKAKTAAGTMRRPPIAEPLRPILLRAHLRAGRPTTGRVCAVSVMSGKIGQRAREAWGWKRDPKTKAWVKARPDALEPVTLHNARHTYASFLMAAGYTLKEIMDFGGWSDLQMVNRYVKLLGQPDETDPAERLNAYLRGATG